MWDLLVSVPDHCLSFYFDETSNNYITAEVDVGSTRTITVFCTVLALGPFKHLMEVFKRHGFLRETAT